MRCISKKPVVIEAMQYDGTINSFLQVNKFAGDRLFVNAGIVTIETLEGDMIVSPGDYVIKGIKGELYPCKPDIFEQTYEVVEG